MNTKTRNIGWLIAAGLLAAALVAPSAAFAIDGSNEKEGGIAWNDPGFQGTGDDCKDAGLEPGEVLWHFVQTSVADEVASGNLWVTVTAAPDELGPIASYKKSGGVLHWAVISGETTLLEWRSDVAGTGNLNLSHICYGGPEEESESPSDEVESESPSDTVESESPSDAVESEVVSEEPSGSVEEVSGEPSGSVEEVSGTPEEEDKTPPSTDSIGAGSTPTSDSWQLILLALSAVLATALIVTPSSRKARR